ncbi:MAG: glutathione S-transferase family protein [Gammaproteobacteria bacterium]|nr:glutathione S-transferase family protein [Gammaproteobacteria bacterium]
MKPTLYGHPFSLYSRKAHLALLHKGIDFDYVNTMPRSQDEPFKSLSPLGKIPAYQDDIDGFSDSSVIAQHVDRAYEGPALLPEDQKARNTALWWDKYADGKMTPIIAGHLFAEVVMAKYVFKRPVIQADVDKAINEELPALHAFLNEHLSGDSWIAGSELSLADISVGGLFITLLHTGQTIPSSAPNVQAYVDRFMALPMVQQVLAIELKVMQAVGYESPLAA